MKLPNWNLKNIFPSVESPEFKNQIQNLTDSIEDIKKFLEKYQDKKLCQEEFMKFLTSYFELYNKTGALSENMNAYVYCLYSTDTTNVQYLNNLKVIEQLNANLESTNVSFSKILKFNYDNLSYFIETNSDFKKYDFILKEEIMNSSHQMSQAEEDLSNQLMSYSGYAWENLHDQLISNMTDSVTGKTFNELRSDAYSPNRNVRKESYLKEIELLRQNEIALAACLNNIKGQTIFLNKKRHWNKAVDRSLFSDRLSPESLSSMIGAIEDSLPMWREFLHLKAKLLNLKNEEGIQDTCAFYDILAPVNSDSSIEKIWTFEEAKNYISEKFHAFSDDMGNFVDNAFKDNWIDAEVKKGKVGGAFCIDFPLSKESRVLTNFTGTTSDLLTLAHELGHAYHFHCIKNEDYALSSYPMTLAETASLFSETMVTNFMYEDFPELKMNLLEMHLSESCQTLVDILSRYYFESSVFAERENNELTAQDFCRLMLEAQEKSYGDGINQIKHPYMWAVKTHYYSPDLDFYNFPYAFGHLFASGLYQLYKEDKKNFPKTYSDLLSQTGRLSCEQVCSNAGFDIKEKSFWESGISLLRKELEMLKHV
ncbi:MAG: M3 family oligoendopeptidase [Treponemataceae bacterium]|nr:M3 family oligoendopeptidase [Treponemataceae bacterium]